jgi:hypothetical protein
MQQITNSIVQKRAQTFKDQFLGANQVLAEDLRLEEPAQNSDVNQLNSKVLGPPFFGFDSN